MDRKKQLGIIGAVAVAAIIGVIIMTLSSSPVSAPQETKSITEKNFLTVNGSRLVDRDGNEVRLRGVNLGGWMVQECWMCPISGEDGEWGNLDTIRAFQTNGLSDRQIQQLFDTYQDNWITEYDLDVIAEAGANCVRVPFWYRNFMLNEMGDWINDNLDENPGFKRLDWIIEQAGRRGIYVILDLHGVPGGQSMNHSTGTVGRNDLYSSRECRTAMKKLWTAIAKRYKDNPTIAAYDIMNEPQNNSGFESNANYADPWDAAAWEQTNDVYREMITAVREIDMEHVISVEGIWRIENLPYPEDEGWTNMLYQVHLYDNTEQFKSLVADIANYGKAHEVAILVGEFSNMDGIAICEACGVNWTTWSYKGGRGSNGTWFWCYGNTEAVDPAADSFEAVLEKWGEVLRTENHFNTSRLVYDKVMSALSVSN